MFGSAAFHNLHTQGADHPGDIHSKLWIIPVDEGVETCGGLCVKRVVVAPACGKIGTPKAQVETLGFCDFLGTSTKTVKSCGKVDVWRGWGRALSVFEQACCAKGPEKDNACEQISRFFNECG